MEKESYTLRELSEELVMTVRALRMYIRQGTLNARKVGRTYLVSKMALNDFLRAGVVLSKFGVGRG